MIKPQRDMMLTETGGILTSDPFEARKLYTRHFSFAPIIGFGYWRDIYDEEKLGLGGVTNNLILPFIRIQWGYLLKPELRQPEKNKN